MTNKGKTRPQLSAERAALRRRGVELEAAAIHSASALPGEQTDPQAESLQSWLVSFLELTSDLVALVDGKGRGLYLNDAGRRLLGVGADEDVGQYALADFAGGSAWNEAQAAAQRDGAWSGELTLRSRAGAEATVSAVILAHPGPEGRPAGYSLLAHDVTARRQAERALLRERDLAQQYLDIAEVILVALDETGTITLLNRKGCAVLGYEASELLGRNWFDTCLPARIRAEVHGVFRRLMAGEVEPITYYENPVLTRSGAERLIAWHNTLLTDDAGRIVGTLSSGEDITERRQAEDARRESERRYHMLVETAPVGIFRTDAQGQTTYVNPRWCEVAGLPAAAALGDGWLRAVHPQDRERVAAGWTAAVQTERISQAEYRFLRPDGAIAHVVGQAIPETDDAGRIVGYVGTITDITERRQMEQALRDSVAELLVIHQNAPIALMLVDRDRRVCKVNQAAALFAGRPAAELLGLRSGEALRCLHHLDDPQGCGFGPACAACAVRQTVLDTFATGRNRQNVEAWLPVSRGDKVEERCVLVSTAYLPVDSLDRVLVCLQDITERKRAEIDLRRRHHELDVLHRIGLALAGTLELPAVCRIAHEHVSELVDCPNFGISLYDPAARTLRAAFVLSDGEPLDVAQLPPLPLVESTPLRGRGRAIVTGQPEVVDDLQEAVAAAGPGAPVVLLGDERVPRSALYVPLKVRDQVIGLLEAQCYRPRAYDEAAVNLLTLVGQQVALALESARLFQETRRLKEFHEGIIQNLAEGIVLLDPEGTITFVNPAGAAAWGYAPSDVVGHHWMEFVHPNQRDNIRQAAGRRRQGQSDHYEIELLRQDGRWATALVTATPRFEEGQFVGSMAVFVDITARRQAEQTLEQRAHQLALLNDVGCQVAAILDLDQVLERAVRLVQEKFGYHHVAVFTLDQEQGVWVQRARAGQFAHLFPPGHHLQMSLGLVGWVGQHGQTLLANDVAAEPRYVNLYPDQVPTRAELSVPIRVGDQVVGVFDVQSPQVNAFDANDVLVMETLASQLAVAIENARLYEETRRTKEFNEGIVQNMAEGIIVRDAAGRVTFCNPAMAAMLGYTPPELLGTHWAMLVPPDQREAVRQDIERSRRGEGSHREAELLHRDGHRVPVLVAGTPRFESGQFVDTQVVFADITEIKRAEAAEREQRELAEALRDTAEALNRTLDPAEVLARILANVGRVVPHDAADIMLIERGVARVAQMRGYAERGMAKEMLALRVVVADVPSYRQMAATGQPYIVPDVAAEPRWVDLGCTSWQRSYLGVPIRAAGEVIGFLNLDSATPGFYTEAHARRLQAFADQAAVAITNARLYEQAQRRAEQLAAVSALGRALTETLDLPQIYDRLNRAIHDLLPDICGLLISLFDPARNLITCAYGYTDGERVNPADLPPVPLAPPGQGIQSQVIHTRQPLIVDNLPERLKDARINVTVGQPEPEPQSGLYVPMLARGEVIGLINVQSYTPGRFSPADAELLALVGHTAAIAIANARLLERTREQARQLQRIMNTVPEGITLLDAARRVIRANTLAVDYLLAMGMDVSATEAVTHLGGRPLEELLQPSSEGRGHEVEAIGPPRRVFEIAARPLEDGPEAGGWVLALRDVTQEREMQKYVQQQDRLAAVGQLAAGIAHDFNNILTSIIGYAQLLQRLPNVPEFVQDKLQVIDQQGQRAAQLVRQILDFSRQSITQRQPLDLAPFLKETCKLLERTIPEHIHVVIELTPDEYLVNADPAQLQRVLTNLAVNARDAMPEGGELRFRLARRAFAADAPRPVPEMGPGDWLVLEVADTGVGVAPEVLPRIFEPFFTTKEVGKGTGLGLSQVYGIVTQHGGYITAQSQVGQGATFTIYLPALPRSAAAPPAHAPAPVVRGHGETLLLVEDEAEVLRVIQSMLEHLGYQVLTASNGQEALAVYDRQRGKIALVLTDLTMPGLGGVDLYRVLKDLNPRVKVVVLTGYPLETEARTLLAEGIVDWVQKPPAMEQLARVVSRALGQ